MNNGEILAKQFTELGMPLSFVKVITFFQLRLYYFNMMNVAQFDERVIKKILKKVSVYNRWDYDYFPTHDTHFAISTKVEGGKNSVDITEVSRGAVGVEFGKGDFFFDWNIVKHMLVAGTTGAGKSVFLNTLLYSIFLKYGGNLIVDIIDVKQIGFNFWRKKNCAVYTEMPMIEAHLRRLCDTMESRYKTLASNPKEKLLPIFVVIDELADLMLNKGYACEEYIIRLAQKSRGANIHLILATQRPTVNVVNGLIKANCDTRVCLKVASVRDSVVILDHKGGEKLNGHGDSLIKLPNDYAEKRVQIAFHDFDSE